VNIKLSTFGPLRSRDISSLKSVGSKEGLESTIARVDAELTAEIRTLREETHG
jgi:hypothetical protein